MRFRGLGNRCGRVTGPCIGVRAPFRDNVPQSAVLLLDDANAGAVVLLDRAAGICVVRGGLASHLAVICTEMNLPFLTLSGSCAAALAGQWVTLDSDAGEIGAISLT